MKRTVLCMVVVLALAVSAGAVVGGGDVTLAVKDAGDVVFSHEGHVSGAGRSCMDCHDSLYVTKEKHRAVTMAAMQKGRSCGACHDGKKAFSVKADCGRCHKK